MTAYSYSTHFCSFFFLKVTPTGIFNYTMLLLFSFGLLWYKAIVRKLSFLVFINLRDIQAVDFLDPGNVRSLSHI